MPLQYLADGNLMTVTLASDYTAGDGHMHLTAGQGAWLPATGLLWLSTVTGTYRVWRVDTRSTDQINITPAQDGTEDGNLAAGATLKWTLGATALDQLRADLHQTGADASKVAAKAGSLYLPDNGIYIRRDTGAAWRQWGPIFPMIEPNDADFSADLGTPAKDLTRGGIILSMAAGTDNHAGRTFAYPGVAFTYDVAVLLMSRLEQYHGAGIGLYDGTKLKEIKLTSGTALAGLAMQNWSNITTYNSGAMGFIENIVSPFRDWMFLRFEDTGTTWNAYWCQDGYSWELLGTEDKNTYLTPTKIGIVIHNSQATRGTKAWFMHALKT